MNQPSNASPNPILITLLVAAGVFIIGLIGITVGLQTFAGRVKPTPTVNIAALPLTPLPATPPIVTAEPAATATPTASTLTPTPTTTPTATSTTTPTATPTTNSTATTIPSPTTYSGPFRNNGGDYIGVSRDSIVIDGQLGEWGSIPIIPLTFVQQGAENFEGAQDFSVNARLAWDDAHLYLAAAVTDDAHVQEMRSYDLFNGDSVEIWLDVDLGGDFSNETLNGDEFQFGFSPGNFASKDSGTTAPEGVVWYPQRQPDWNRQLRIAAMQTGAAGYDLEAAIPWSLLGVLPDVGTAFGFAVNANDNDVPGTAAQQTILRHTPGMAWGQPLTFSNLRLQ